MKKKALLLIFSLMFSVYSYAQKKIDYSNESSEKFVERMQWFADAKYGYPIAPNISDREIKI